ncbi:ATP synthase F1 subunit gamma [Chrysiogenes arsenatis]|uniref:ATP synthase F1 subunit gamma n=1 Tax=Chrysiogenes arsenatis TaxID=309797 RepID=UPI000426F32A|nr:ATP synthase F1 subunit gamma [Chrysiogenes arsenatis]
MAGSKEIKRRIVSVKNTRQITKAMKMVSAAKLRRAQEAVQSARPYANKLREVIANLAARTSEDAHPMLANPKEVKKVLFYVFTSDRGLCGSFNSALIRAAKLAIQQKRSEGITVDVIAIGKKGRDAFRRDQGFQKAFIDITGRLNYDDVQTIAGELSESFMSGTYDEVHSVYNKFVTVLTQVPTAVRVLPIEATPNDGSDEEALGYLYEPSEEQLLAELLPKNVEVQVNAMLLNSMASEQASRMTAMDSATNNASEMLRKLSLKYNRARQAAITTELSEIIAGAGAL